MYANSFQVSQKSKQPQYEYGLILWLLLGANIFAYLPKKSTHLFSSDDFAFFLG